MANKKRIVSQVQVPTKVLWSVRRLRKASIVIVAVAVVLVFVVWALAAAGPYLSINNARPSDAILVLAGDENDKRYWFALAMLRKGMGREMFVDEPTDLIMFGNTMAQTAEGFIHATAGVDQSRVHVCPTQGDSTKQEMTHIAPCLNSVHARSVIVVSDDHHTRRALDIASRTLPQYQWTAAGVPTAVGQRGWWRSRYGMKYAFIEWQRLVWWKVVESHQ